MDYFSQIMSCFLKKKEESEDSSPLRVAFGMAAGLAGSVRRKDLCGVFHPDSQSHVESAPFLRFQKRTLPPMNQLRGSDGP